MRFREQSSTNTVVSPSVLHLTEASTLAERETTEFLFSETTETFQCRQDHCETVLPVSCAVCYDEYISHRRANLIPGQRKASD